VWLAHFVVFAVIAGIFFRSYSGSIGTGIWIGLLAVHLANVIARDLRGRMLIRQIEARYGWDNWLINANGCTLPTLMK